MPLKTRRRTGGLLLRLGFAALLALPWPLWWLLGPHLDAASHENRAPAAFPTLSAGVDAWPAAFEDWLGDHAPFRNQLMTLNAGLNRLVGTVDSTTVLGGKEGWLFLKNDNGMDCLADYQGTNLFTDEQTAAYAAGLTALQDALAQRGSRLLVVFAPEKSGVYNRLMPDTIPPAAGQTRVQALTDALRGAGLTVVWPQAALRELSAQEQVYYKYDTHWNDVGAWLAAQQALAALGLPAQSTLPTVAPDPGATAPADLAGMAALWPYCTDDLYLAVQSPQAVLAASELGGQLQHYTGAGAETLLLLRDSFGAALAPHLCAGFAASTVLHADSLSASTLSAAQPDLPDVVVLEIAERYAALLPARAETLLNWVQGFPS